MSSYPLVNFHFSVEWGGTRIRISEVSGLDDEHEILEYRKGASPEFSTIKMPGMQKFSNIILKRGSFQGDNEFYQWRNTIALTSVERRDITISLLNDSHEPVVIWKVYNAWPVSLKFADLNAMKSEIFIESLELAHEGFTMENLGK